jgi:hypothetical protein
MDGETDQAMIDPMQPMPVKKIQNEQGIVIKKIYNPNVGKYDVAVTVGPSYMTKRQESLDAMSQLLQGNPQLWAVAGDLFIKHMDWPGAQEMAARFAKTIDPKLLSDEDDPALQAANQQMQAMGQEMQQMHQMLQNVSQSMEAQTLKVKEFEAKSKPTTRRLSGSAQCKPVCREEQIQDIVMGTVHGMITRKDLINEMPGRDQDIHAARHDARDAAHATNAAGYGTNAAAGYGTNATARDATVKCTDFMGMLFLARDVAHSVHLNTRSYSKHVALNIFYERIVGAADDFAEAYQGRHGLIGPISLMSAKKTANIIEFLEDQLKEIEACSI